MKVTHTYLRKRLGNQKLAELLSAKIFVPLYVDSAKTRPRKGHDGLNMLENHRPPSQWPKWARQIWYGTISGRP